MATVDCGNLHIRTPETDSSLSPNNIIQSITNLGLRIGIIPESSVSDMKDFIITIKNNANNIIFQNSIPIPQSFYGDYIFVTIPFSVIPKINEVISIKIVGTTGCVFTKNYTILSYSSLSVFKPAISPFVKPTDKYIKITPTLTQYGFISGSSYFFKCDKNTDSDDNCLTQFNNNTDLSKIISFLPYGTTIADCIDSDDWVYVDTVCVQSGLLPTTSTTSLPVSSTPTLSTVSASNLTYTSIVSNSIIKLYKDDVYTNQSITATSDGIWNGLSLISGVYKITSSESNKSESAKSNAITFNVTTAGSVTATPTLNSVNANSVTYSSYTTGTTLKLYKNGVYTNLSFVANSGTWTGLTLTTGEYTITATDSSKTESAKSNSITFTVSTGVSIVEPSKPKYFFSDGNRPSDYDSKVKLPAIFTNTPRYSATDDFVWLQNDKIKIAVNLKRGGQIAWASLLNDTTNLVYNGYDGGFQVTMDAYQRPDGFHKNGKFSRASYNEVGQYSDSATAYPNSPLTSYNSTMGGDFLNHSQSLIDYHVVTNGYYVKFRPIFYTINSEVSETYIEVTYTLDGYAVKCDYRYTSFRSDGQYSGGGFDGGHAPVCFLVNNLTNYKSYTGNNAWSRTSSPSTYTANVEDGLLPNESSNETPLTKNSKERWSLVYNRDNQKTIGVYANTTDTENSFSLKQKEVYIENGNARAGDEFTGGYTILGRNFDLVPFLTDFDRTNFAKDVSSYLIITPDTNKFIDEVYRVSGH